MIDFRSCSMKAQLRVMLVLLGTLHAASLEPPVLAGDAPDSILLDEIMPLLDDLAVAELGQDLHEKTAFVRQISTEWMWKDSKNVVARGRLCEIDASQVVLDFGEGPQVVKLTRLSAKSRGDIRKTAKVVGELKAFFLDNKEKISEAKRRNQERIAREQELASFKETFGLDLQALPTNAVSAITKHNDVLVLRDLKGFTPEHCRLLTQTSLNGIAIEKESLAELTVERAKALASSSKTLNVVTDAPAGNIGLPAEVIAALASTSGRLMFPSLRSLPCEEAECLSAHGGVLTLPTLSNLTPEAAVALNQHKERIEFGDLDALRKSSAPQAWEELKRHPTIGPELNAMAELAAMRDRQRKAVENAKLIIWITRLRMDRTQPAMFRATLHNHTDGSIWCTMKLRTVMGEFEAWLWDVRAGGSDSANMNYKDRFFIKDVAATCDVTVEFEKMTKNGNDVLGQGPVVIIIEDRGDPEEFDRYRVPGFCTKVRSSLIVD